MMHSLSLSDLSVDLYEPNPSPLSYDDSTYSLSSAAISPDLEESFCSNYSCCGRALADLHELIEHYESVHVRVEESPNTYENSDSEEFSSTNNHLKSSRRRRHLSIGIEPCDYREDLCAFDNTVIRRTHPYLPAPFPKRKPMPAMRSLDEGEERFNIVCNLLAGNLIEDTSQRELPESMEYMEHRGFQERDEGRPYACTVPGCDKSYKNANGLKYHSLHGHGIPSNEKDKPYRCPSFGCSKRYKNPNGLKYHMTHAHINSSMSPQTLSKSSSFPRSHSTSV